MNQPEITSGLLSLLPSFSTLKAPLDEDGGASESLFSQVLSDITPDESSQPEKAGLSGESLPLMGQALPLLSGPATEQPNRLLERIRQSQQVAMNHLSSAADITMVSAGDSSRTASEQMQLMSVAMTVDAEASAQAHSLSAENASKANVAVPVKAFSTAVPFDQVQSQEEEALEWSQELNSDSAEQATLLPKNRQDSVTSNSAQTNFSADPVVNHQPVATNDGLVLSRSDSFVNGDDALLTDIELEQMDEQQQLTEHKSRLEFGSDKQQWTPAMGSRILTMVADNIQQAEIHLDPPELGSMEIKLQLNQEQTSVQVQVQNPQVKEVLEVNAQRLRDVLAEQGLELSEFDVSDQSQFSQGEQNNSDDSASDSAEPEWVAEEENPKPQQLSSANGLFDAYA